MRFVGSDLIKLYIINLFVVNNIYIQQEPIQYDIKQYKAHITPLIKLVRCLYIRHKKKPSKRLEIDCNKKALIYTNKKNPQ